MVELAVPDPLGDMLSLGVALCVGVVVGDTLGVPDALDVGVLVDVPR